MVNKKDLGDKLCVVGFDLFKLGFNYGNMGTKYNIDTIKFKIRQKVFRCLDSFIMSKEEKLRESNFESSLIKNTCQSMKHNKF